MLETSLNLIQLIQYNEGDGKKNDRRSQYYRLKKKKQTRNETHNSVFTVLNVYTNKNIAVSF